MEVIFKEFYINIIGSANSKYAFLGSLRSTAQLISYELVLSSAILLVIMLTGNLNLGVDIESQRAVWFIFPLFPIFLIFFVGAVAETNRAPFDLAEAMFKSVFSNLTELHSNTLNFFNFILVVCSLGIIFNLFPWSVYADFNSGHPEWWATSLLLAPNKGEGDNPTSPDGKGGR